MSKKVLVAYTSAVGSTAEIAQNIAETIHQEIGYDATALNIINVKPVSNYDAFVLGSTIRMGRLVSSMVNYSPDLYCFNHSLPGRFSLHTYCLNYFRTLLTPGGRF
ncbi:MAG: flavodoxin domain-containing protein [Chitinispirillaceae bacterium]